MLLALALLLACLRPPPSTETAASSPAAPAAAAEVPATTVAARAEVPGLAGLACTAEGACTALVDGRLWGLDPVTLALVEDLGPAALDGETVEGLFDHGGPLLWSACAAEPCARAPGAPDPVDLHAPPPADPRTRWNEAIAQGWRSPFAAQLPSPGGGRMSFVGNPSPRVMVSGGGLRQMTVDASPADARYLRALALHPSGREAYLVAWPGDVLLAFDPVALRSRWRIPLRPAAHGLYVDASGRHLLLEEGGAVDPDRVLDLGGDQPALPKGGDPASDLFLHLAERPDAVTTAVVDLAVPRLVWREDGRYLSLQALPDGSLLLATTQALVRLQPPPRPAAH